VGCTGSRSGGTAADERSTAQLLGTGAARRAGAREAKEAEYRAGAVADPGPTSFTTNAVGAVAATAVAGRLLGAGLAIRGATGCGTASTTHLLPRRTLTLARRAVVGLSRNGAGGFGEVGSAPRLRRTREARPLPFRALAYTLLLFWSTTTEEALTEVGARTLTTSSTLGGSCHPWEGGQRAPLRGLLPST
jgi:hypothetical protein